MKKKVVCDQNSMLSIKRTIQMSANKYQILKEDRAGSLSSQASDQEFDRSRHSSVSTEVSEIDSRSNSIAEDWQSSGAIAEEADSPASTKAVSQIRNPSIEVDVVDVKDLVINARKI